MADLSPTATALLLLDPRGDLLAASEVAGGYHVEAAPLRRVLGWLEDAARQQGRTIVRAAEPSLAELTRLRDAGLGRLVVAGALTEQGVLGAARTARGLGLAVEVLDDATAATTAARQARALREAAALGARVRGWGELLNEGDRVVRVGPIGDGTTWLWCGALREAMGEADEGEGGAGEGEAAEVYGAIEREVSWSRMVHRGGEVPRLVALQGRVEPDGVEPLYRHPADEQPPMHPWTPRVDRLRRAVEAHVGHPLNHGLLQLYRHGRDWISEHADKTLDLVRPSVIVNVSLGQRRTMLLRPKVGAGLVEKVPLPHGSLLVMSLATNRSHHHAIRQQNGLEGARISLTFRSIGTFRDRASGAVWGVGAPAADRAGAERQAAARRALDPAARADVERAEATAMLRLFRQENADDAFDADAYRPGFAVVDLGVLNE